MLRRDPSTRYRMIPTAAAIRPSTTGSRGQIVGSAGAAVGVGVSGRDGTSRRPAEDDDGVIDGVLCQPRPPPAARGDAASGAAPVPHPGRWLRRETGPRDQARLWPKPVALWTERVGGGRRRSVAGIAVPGPRRCRPAPGAGHAPRRPGGVQPASACAALPARKQRAAQPTSMNAARGRLRPAPCAVSRHPASPTHDRARRTHAARSRPAAPRPARRARCRCSRPGPCFLQ